jgi:hypothetical protein
MRAEAVVATGASSRKKALLGIWKNAGPDDLQIVVFCEIEDEVICQRLDFTQLFIDHY